MEADQKKSRAQELFDMLTAELQREALEGVHQKLASMFGVTIKPEGEPAPKIKYGNVEVPASAFKDVRRLVDGKLVPEEKPKRIMSPQALRKLRKNLKKARAAKAEKALAAKRSTRKVSRKPKKK